MDYCCNNVEILHKPYGLCSAAATLVSGVATKRLTGQQNGIVSFVARLF